MSGIGDEVERIVAPLVKPGASECRPCQERKKKLNKLEPGQVPSADLANIVDEIASEMAREKTNLRGFLSMLPESARKKAAELILKKAIARSRKV